LGELDTELSAIKDTDRNTAYAALRMIWPLILLFIFISFSILIWKFTDKVLGKLKPIRLRPTSPYLANKCKFL
jgi:hypothetical protein